MMIIQQAIFHEESDVTTSVFGSSEKYSLKLNITKKIRNPLILLGFRGFCKAGSTKLIFVLKSLKHQYRKESEMTKVKVCDALCGAGKTSAVINMMNEGGDEHRYIFITRFLTEVDRIVRDCPNGNFVAPSDDETRKIDNLHELLAARRNIASTHSLFLRITEKTKDLIRQGNYILVLDESVEAVTESDLTRKDFELFERAGFAKMDGENIVWLEETPEETDKKFRDWRYYNEAQLAQSRRLCCFEDEYFFWTIPADLFHSFDSVYILTYMFCAQPLRCFFDINHIEYELIGVKRENGIYKLCPAEETDRKIDIRDKVNILENYGRVNSVGEKRTNLSYGWYIRCGADDKKKRAERVRKNLVNVKRNAFACASDDFMWTTFKGSREIVKDRSLGKGFVVYNKRASNEYADRHYLAYCVNNFPRPMEERYYRSHGAYLDPDMYALSFLVQWMFRSAIRKGENISIYVPSARMRTLLKKWLDNLAEGKDLEPVTATKRPRKKKDKKEVEVIVNG